MSTPTRSTAAITSRHGRKTRFGAWQRKKLSELYRERGPLVMKQFEAPEQYTATMCRLQKHIEREIDFYSMWQMRPNFERMEREIKDTRALNRRIRRHVLGVSNGP